MSKRLRFFLGHFAISAALTFASVVWIFNIWYPMPLASAIGVTEIFLMLICIDMIVGPLLGWMVYKEHKASLKFDLGIVIFIQICAFFYGFYSITEGRPVWLVYNVDRFEVIRANELIMDKIEQASPNYQNPSWWKPQFVGVKFSQNIEQKNQDMFEEILAGISIAQRPERYVPLEQVSSQIQQRSQNLNALLDFNEKADVDNTLKKYPAANAWVPLKANHQDMVVLINKDQAKVIKIVNLKPWS
jgi:hypothetical protein